MTPARPPSTSGTRATDHSPVAPRVTVAVHHPVPAVRLPFIGGFGHAFDVVARQSEVVDPYRSGLPGEASC